jgi:Leucine-rich repeat (LRR) protein
LEEIEMKKRVLSAIIAAIMVITTIPTVSVSATMQEVRINLSQRGITNEQLGKMVASGEIPHNVTHLRLSFNQISDITPLSELTNLRGVWLTGNQISDLNPLSGLTNLQNLELGHNQISDLTPLAGLINLGTTMGDGLDLSNNQITDITPLKNLIVLQFLNLAENQITDVTPLQGLTNLWWLDLQNNQIEDVSPLAWLTKMDAVTTAGLLRGNPVASDAEQLASLAEARARNTTRTTLTLGHVLGTRDYTVHDAIEILRHVVGLPSVLDSGCAVTIMAALIVSEKVPDVQDAIAILRSLLELPNALDERL